MLVVLDPFDVPRAFHVLYHNKGQYKDMTNGIVC